MSLENALSFIESCEESNIADKKIWQELYEGHFKNMNCSIKEQLSLYKRVYRNRNESNPGPIWVANSDSNCNAKQAINDLQLNSVEELYEFSVENKTKFYDYILNKLNISFSTKYKSIIDPKSDLHEANWLPEAKLNIVDSCFNAPPDAIAIINDEKDSLNQVTYSKLEKMVNSFASNLISSGIKPGDHIGVFMSMDTQAIVAYLAIIKVGAIAVSIADSFATNEIQLRVDIAKANYLITQDSFERAGKKIHLYERTKDIKNVTTIVLSDKEGFQALSKDIVAFNWLNNKDKDKIESHICSPHEQVNVLFSSGTTGTPKAIPWDHTTPMKCAIDGFFNQDIQSGNVVAWPTNLGWMMGPWLVFATLINKGSIAISKHAPITNDFCNFIEIAKINILGVVPSIVRRWRENDSLSNLDLSNIKLFTSTGESSSPDDMFYLMASAKYKPVMEYCGGTEIGGAYASGTLLHDCIPSTFPTANFATQIVLLNSENKSCKQGELALIPPTLGFSRTLLNRDHFKVYYEGMPIHKDSLHYRRHGDEFIQLDNNYYRALGRCDDTMNLGAIKTSSAEIERCLSDVTGLHEVAAIAATPKEGGPSQLILFVVTDREDLKPLQVEIQSCIKNKLNPLFRVSEIRSIDKLPRTSSNKVMRRVLRDIVIGDGSE